MVCLRRYNKVLYTRWRIKEWCEELVLIIKHKIVKIRVDPSCAVFSPVLRQTCGTCVIIVYLFVAMVPLTPTIIVYVFDAVDP